jgi:hypothetical protein
VNDEEQGPSGPPVSAPPVSIVAADDIKASSASVSPVAEPGFTNKAAARMLDVHAPHETLGTWKAFFIHLVTIVIGLLIAIGLEQSVEYFHHRRQVAEIRRSLADERRINEVIFTGACNEFRRYAPILFGSLQTLTYLRTHPGAPPGQWPGRFSFYMLTIRFQDSAWKTALQSAALEYMPRAEVRNYSDVYARLAEVSEESLAELHAVIRAKSFMLQVTDPATISSEQSIRAYTLVSDVATSLYLMGIAERNIARLYSDFHSPPTDMELYGLIPPVPAQQDIEAVREIAAPMAREK